KWNGSTWSAVGSGTSNKVWALTVFNDGTGSALYAGGEFISMGGVTVDRVAKWNGTTWSALPSNLKGDVRVLAVFNDGTGSALYAGGLFSTTGGGIANRIAKWNGTTWSAVGTGMSSTVFGLAVFDDGTGPALYAGGTFTTAGGVSANRIAKWNPGVPGSWSALGSGMDNTVNVLTVFNDGSGTALYAGGVFTTAGGVTTSHIAKWNGSSWSPLGSGANNTVNALNVFDPGSGAALYVGGAFTNVGGVAINRIGKWDGSVWSSLGSGNGMSAPVTVNTLMVYDDGAGAALYAGGDFIAAGSVNANRIGKWNGTAWSALGSGMDGTVNALTVFNDGTGAALYAGGSFTTAGGVSASRIARWNGSTWSALGSGMNNTVNSLAVFDDGSGSALYAGGSFTTAGGVTANRIAKWNGSTWSSLGSGMGDTAPVVRALTVFNDGAGAALYAGGFYTTAGGVLAQGIAKWDGLTWSGLGSGMGGTFPSVFSLVVFDDDFGPALYAGGQFTIAGGVAVNRIAKWDGSNWSILGSGVGSTVNALSIFADGTGRALYATGSFTTAGVATVNRIAGWGGATWSALGSGENASVLAATFFDDGTGPALYAGGIFSTAGGNSSAGIAKWMCACTPPDCDDGNVCTPATCDLMLGCTQHEGTGVTIACNDRNACTAVGVCHGDAAGTCDPGPWCILDLDTNGVMGTGDFARFSPCFGACYPPGDPCLASNFNGDSGGCIGTSDFAMFAGCFGDICGQCAVCASAAAASVAANTEWSSDAATAVVKIAVVAQPTATDVAPSPPASSPQLQVGQQFWIEFWGRLHEQTGASSNGLASAYMDVQYDPSLLEVTEMNVGKPFPVFANGTNDAEMGTVHALGGCASLGDRMVGADGVWVRIAFLTAVALRGGSGVIATGSSDDLHGLAVVGRFQNIDPSEIEFGAARVIVSGKRHSSRVDR
ncbi:MAG: hypothetical protein HY287_18340, partial [Planctomycetes bacterium]|nr:hypothetical protein [Planctomycetota bacterium]